MWGEVERHHTKVWFSRVLDACPKLIHDVPDWQRVFSLITGWKEGREEEEVIISHKLLILFVLHDNLPQLKSGL